MTQPEANLRFGSQVCHCKPRLSSSVFATQQLGGPGITEAMAEKAVRTLARTGLPGASVDLDRVEAWRCSKWAGVAHYEAPLELGVDA